MAIGIYNSKIMKKHSLSLLLVVCTTFFSSCATIVSGSKAKVTIDGNTLEPVTIQTSYTTYENVILPQQVKLKRKHLSGQRIKITSPNYIFIDKTINEWTFGNILLGGLIGWSVDLITNCVSKPDDNHYYINGIPKENKRDSLDIRY